MMVRFVHHLCAARLVVSVVDLVAFVTSSLRGRGWRLQWSSHLAAGGERGHVVTIPMAELAR